MGMIPLSEEIERLVQQEVAAGRAATPAAFVEAAVLHLIEAARAEEAELRALVAEADADIAAGRFVTVSSAEESHALRDSVIDGLRARRAGAG